MGSDYPAGAALADAAASRLRVADRLRPRPWWFLALDAEGITVGLSAAFAPAPLVALLCSGVSMLCAAVAIDASRSGLAVRFGAAAPWAGVLATMVATVAMHLVLLGWTRGSHRRIAAG